MSLQPNNEYSMLTKIINPELVTKFKDWQKEYKQFVIIAHTNPDGDAIGCAYALAYALRKCGKASFCVLDEGTQKPGRWDLDFRSVVVFGRVAFVEERERIYAVARALSRKFTDDEAYIEAEVARSGPGTCVFCLIPEHMTGKLVNES